MNAEEIKRILKLEPLPGEGGFFAEVFRSEHRLGVESLPRGYRQPRSLATAIYYLLTTESFSAMHRLPTDEVFHFYLGDAVELLQLHEDGSGTVVVLGADLKRGMHPQAVVPARSWQGSRLLPGGEFALLGTTMAPGFDFQDYEAGVYERLVNEYPEFEEKIRKRCRGLTGH